MSTNDCFRLNGVFERFLSRDTFSVLQIALDWLENNEDLCLWWWFRGIPAGFLGGNGYEKGFFLAALLGLLLLLRVKARFRGLWTAVLYIELTWLVVSLKFWRPVFKFPCVCANVWFEAYLFKSSLVFLFITLGVIIELWTTPVTVLLKDLLPLTLFIRSWIDKLEVLLLFDMLSS